MLHYVPLLMIGAKTPQATPNDRNSQYAIL
jgi:hypothetical protein